MAAVAWISLLAAHPSDLMAAGKGGRNLGVAVNVELEAWHGQLVHVARPAQLVQLLLALVHHLTCPN
eukprot:scaffold63219_cov33-Tisochrysis_lutea.AAC.3